MSINSSNRDSNTDPADAKPLPTAEKKLQLQVAIFEVTRDAEGKSLPEIREMLQSAFSRRRVEQPTNIWLDSVASEAFYGNPYIIDLPTALAADAAIPVPTEDMKRRLASRRELRKEKLPAGTFPAASDWKLADSEVTGRTQEPGHRTNSRDPSGSTRGARQLLAVATLTAASILTILAVRAARNTLRWSTRRTAADAA